MNTLKRNLLISIAALVAWNAPAMADPVWGEAHGDGGDSDWIQFYIPLDGIFTGLGHQDSCSTYSSDPGNDCTGGQLHLFMDFAIDWTGQTVVHIDFMDFDHPDGYADNDWFSELLEIVVRDGDGNLIEDFGLSEIMSMLSGDQDSQYLTLQLDVMGAIEIEYIFSTHLDRDGHFRNTPEYLRAVAKSVPEPGTLALLGAGLLLLAASRRRKPKRDGL